MVGPRPGGGLTSGSVLTCPEPHAQGMPDRMHPSACTLSRALSRAHSASQPLCIKMKP